MDELLTIALVGTAKKRPATVQNAPAARLIAQLDGLSPERRLLLQAGAADVYAFAGATAASLTQTVAPAPPEGRRIISPPTAILLAELLQRPAAEPELLLEACELLREHEQVLAPAMLPDALAVRDSAVRAALQPVLGERGRWLSQFRDEWQWARSPLSGDEEFSSEELEAMWNEGLIAVRQVALERMRRTDPERARQSLREAWPREKADVRLQLLETVASSVNNEDASFLEGLVSDRSAAVRARASELLCTLEGSRMASRVREWCDELVGRQAPAASLGAKLRKLAGGGALRLAITPPAEYDAAWGELGVSEKPPANVGKRAYWLVELVRRVNPQHWQQKFQAEPRELIAAVEGDEYGPEAVHAWSDAAALFAAEDWAEALWAFWLHQGAAQKDATKQQRRSDELVKLLRTMPVKSAEQALQACLGQFSAKTQPLRESLEALPKPWSERFSAAYLEYARGALAKMKADDRVAWADTLPVAALALPAGCFAEALREWTIPEADDYYGRYIGNQLAKFLEALQTRARLRELITAG